MTAGVYLLKDPKDGVVGYVGISMNIEERFLRHKRDPHSKKLRAWIEAVVDPELVVVKETSSLEEQNELEKALILEHKKTIVNSTRGGAGGAQREPKQQISLVLEADIKAFFEEMANANDRSLSWVVSRVLKNYVAEAKAKVSK